MQNMSYCESENVQKALSIIFAMIPESIKPDVISVEPFRLPSGKAACKMHLSRTITNKESEELKECPHVKHVLTQTLENADRSTLYLA